MADDLQSLLSFDALDAAEKLTGESYKTNEGTMALGFALMHSHAKRKNAALLAEGDTMLSNDLARYLSIIERLGFERVLEEGFVSHFDGSPERFFVFARRDGLLLTFDTYNGKGVNGGHLYFNWRSADETHPWLPGVSGGYEGPDDGPWTLVGSHDCREALVHKIRTLEERGTLIAPWVKRPFLWLLHYSDTKVEGYDYTAINAKRLSLLPDWVQAMTCGETSIAKAEGRS